MWRGGPLVNSLVLLAGALAGLGAFVVIAQSIPSRPRLDAALARIQAAGTQEPPLPTSRGLVRRMAAEMAWAPVPAADLALLGQDREAWLARKIICGLTGLGVVPALTGLATVAGFRLPWTIPSVASLALGAAAFVAPDQVTAAKAAARRTDFRHALTSYLDLVALERAAGAGPTDALEAAAQVGGGWAFARIEAALHTSRKAGRPPWEGLAALAAQTGVGELSDLADIAEVAGHEGARILQTLASRAESMRAEALAATKARAGARSTTMVVPIALLGAGFLVLLIFPILYRTFG
jgi:Flp pilus assembly protein TadB